MIVPLLIITYLLTWPVVAGLLVRYDLMDPAEAMVASIVWPMAAPLAIFLAIFALVSGEEIL